MLRHKTKTEVKGKRKTQKTGRRQKAKAEGEGIDRRIKQTWQRQNTNAEAKV